MTNKPIETLKDPAKTAAGAQHDSGYAQVNGLKMYYEDHNPSAGGVPLVLLHGSFSAIGSSFGAFLPGLAASRRVIGIDQQGHGRTADIDRPLSSAQMAEDTAALLRQLNIRQADFFGYSLGGDVAFQLAQRHPDMARKIIYMGGTSFHPSGMYPEMRANMDQISPEMFAGSPWLEEYNRINPHPENFPTLVEKIKQLDQATRGYTPEEVERIQAPVLLVIGDADIVRPEHVVEMYRLLGGGGLGEMYGMPRARLAVLPATTHSGIVQRAGWILPMVEEFLDAPMPE